MELSGKVRLARVTLRVISAFDTKHHHTEKLERVRYRLHYKVDTRETSWTIENISDGQLPQPSAFRILEWTPMEERVQIETRLAEVALKQVQSAYLAYNRPRAISYARHFLYLRAREFSSARPVHCYSFARVQDAALAFPIVERALQR